MQDVDETLILIESSPLLVWRFPGSLAEAKGEAIDGHWPQQSLHPTAAAPDVLGSVEAHSPTVNAAATLRWEGDRVVLRGPSWVVDAYCPLDPPKGTWDEYFALCTVDEFGYENERVSCPVSLSLDGLRMVLAAPATVRPDVWEVIGVPMASVLDVLLAHPRPKAKRLRWFGPITTQEAVAVVEAWPNLRYVDTLFSSPIDVSAFSRRIDSSRLYMNEGQFFASAPLPKTTAWFPVTYDRSSDARASRFGGRAWIPAGETWPLCPACGEPFTLIAQFDEAKSPGPLAGSALLQVF